MTELRRNVSTGGPGPGQFLPGGVSYLIEGQGAGSFFFNLLLLSEKYYLRILITADGISENRP